MRNQVSEPMLRASMSNHHRWNCHSQSPVPDGFANGVVISEIVDERIKSTDLREHRTAQRDGSAKTRSGESNGEPKDNARQEIIVDCHCRQVRAKTSQWLAAIETCDQIRAGHR